MSETTINASDVKAAIPASINFSATQKIAKYCFTTEHYIFNQTSKECVDFRNGNSAENDIESMVNRGTLIRKRQSGHARSGQSREKTIFDGHIATIAHYIIGHNADTTIRIFFA
jgi:hypothetical protein